MHLLEGRRSAAPGHGRWVWSICEATLQQILGHLAWVIPRSVSECGEAPAAGSSRLGREAGGATLRVARLVRGLASLVRRMRSLRAVSVRSGGGDAWFLSRFPRTRIRCAQRFDCCTERSLIPDGSAHACGQLAQTNGCQVRGQPWEDFLQRCQAALRVAAGLVLSSAVLLQRTVVRGMLPKPKSLCRKRLYVDSRPAPCFCPGRLR